MDCYVKLEMCFQFFAAMLDRQMLSQHPLTQGTSNSP